MTVKLLTEHNLELLSFQGGCTGRAVAAYLKVVRRRKPSSAEGTRGESMRGGLLHLSLGGFGASPENIFEFWALLCAILMGFCAFGTRF